MEIAGEPTKLQCGQKNFVRGASIEAIFIIELVLPLNITLYTKRLKVSLSWESIIR